MGFEPAPHYARLQTLPPPPKVPAPPVVVENAVGVVNIVLTWGEQPLDLDAHLTVPSPCGLVFHVYHGQESYIYNDELQTVFVQNVKNGYGPETIKIIDLVDGTYNYFVQDYTNHTSTTSDALANSQATVSLYDAENKLLGAFSVPTDRGAFSIWHVFSLVVEDGRYTIVPVNITHNVPTAPRSVRTLE